MSGVIAVLAEILCVFLKLILANTGYVSKELLYFGSRLESVLNIC
jgi:hypothetical protein